MTGLLRIADEVVFRDLGDGGGVLLHTETGAYHRVNGTGAEICRALDGPRALDDVTDTVRAGHEDAPPELAHDVREFARAMIERGLLVEEGQTSTNA